MMGKKKMAMKRGGSPVKKRGGGMLIKKRGGGAMGPKKKMAGGGMMGPKKKMAKGGGVRAALDKLKRRTSTKLDGRSAAAKKIANKSRNTKMKGKLMAGKGNPAGKDMSTMAMINRLLAKGPPKRKGPMPSRPPKTMKPLGRRKKG